MTMRARFRKLFYVFGGVLGAVLSIGLLLLPARPGGFTWGLSETVRSDLASALIGGAVIGGAVLAAEIAFTLQLEKEHLRFELAQRNDLRSIDLRGRDLEYINLSGKVLSGAKFSRAKLANADLSGATLDEADFEKAKLRGANLRRANLVHANLVGADLKGAQLSGAQVTGAKYSAKTAFPPGLPPNPKDLAGGVKVITGRLWP